MGILRHPRKSGFTMVEMLITLIIFGIVAGIAIPSFVVMLPNYRLKSAARDLFSNMQQARMAAIKENQTYRIVFIPGAPGSYEIRDGNNVVIKTVNFSSYASGGGITYGNGDATEAIDGGGFGGDFITYTHATFGDNAAVFTSRGLGDNTGYVYLENTKGTAYLVGSEISGVIKLRKWVGGTGLKWQ